MAWWSGNTVYGKDWAIRFFDKNGGNGGVLLSVGCHRIDLIPWMFETQITEIMTFATVLDKKNQMEYLLIMKIPLCCS
ncbi:MAG: hypothetical protein ACLR8Q_09650 [[Ruminococcus] lactaris]|uniref:Gfo/Idh/MocA family protein n=1 Tax=[Ruminococcus] lactaris TaxID=46228 RepID=UPI0039A31862